MIIDLHGEIVSMFLSHWAYACSNWEVHHICIIGNTGWLVVSSLLYHFWAGMIWVYAYNLTYMINCRMIINLLQMHAVGCQSSSCSFVRLHLLRQKIACSAFLRVSNFYLSALKGENIDCSYVAGLALPLNDLWQSIISECFVKFRFDPNMWQFQSNGY